VGRAHTRGMAAATDELGPDVGVGSRVPQNVTCKLSGSWNLQPPNAVLRPILRNWPPAPAVSRSAAAPCASASSFSTEPAW
jgi:hypothetical protein